MIQSNRNVTGDVEQTHCFARYDYAGLVANVFGINSAPLWPKIAPLFEEYSVTGFRLEYIPGNIHGLASASG